MEWPGSPLLALSLLLSTALVANGLAVMSIDLGSEWIKVGVVSPGVPMDIALNKESKRKTPASMSMRDGERVFGEDALTTGVRFPALSYSYLLDLAGKRLDNPAVQLFLTRFPHYRLEADQQRGTVLFRHDQETVFSVEELLAMILGNARGIASEHTQQPVTEAVITVPAFFSQAERRAVSTAASLAGIKLLQLINDNTAVALNYGMFRRADFNTSAQYILYYDMGAGSASATLVGYQLVKTKERSVTETNPQLQILGYAYDRTLGGLEMTVRLQQHLARAFTEKKKTKLSVYDSPRAMAKLLKEAERAKKVLSANAETYAQVEGLLDEEDFRQLVTRAEFEQLCQDLYPRVWSPVQAAVRAAGMSLQHVDQLILVGGGTRVPWVQQQLETSWGRELGKSVNADEAAALGAVYRAAELTTGFKVLKFHIKDYVNLPVVVDFEREVGEEGGGEVVRRSVRRNLFTLGNPYPQKKVITFNRNRQDFGFSVNYGDLSHLSPEDIRTVDGLNLTYVLLDGVTNAYADNSGEGVDSKGIKVHFQMDESGLLNLTGVEAVFERTLSAGAEADEQDESTLAKLSTAFSSLFGKDGEGTEQGPEGDQQQQPSETAEPAGGSPADKQPAEPASNTTGAGANATAAGNKTEPGKPRIRTVRVPIRFKTTNLNVPDLEAEALETSRQKIAQLDERDRQRRRREQARNALESFINDAQMRLYEEKYELASTEQEREQIRDTTKQVADWLYEEGFDEAAGVFEQKLDEVKTLTKPLYDRVEEHSNREEGVKALKDILNMTSHFLQSADTAVKDGILAETDAQALNKMVTATNEWLKAKLAEQEKTAMTETPKLKLKTMAEKYLALDKEVKYLVNKMKVGTAKKMREEAEKKAKEAAEKIAANTSTDSATTTSTDSGKAGAGGGEETTTEDQQQQSGATPAPEHSGETTTEPPPGTMQQPDDHAEL